MKFFVFTSFLETEPEWHKTCTYLVYQREKCPTTDKLHWQAYVEFKNDKTFSAVQKSLKIGKTHVAKRKGSPTQAAEYCMKDESRMPDTTYTEKGERSADPKQGERTDLKRLRDGCYEVSSMTDILDNNELVNNVAKYGRFAEKCFMAGRKKATRPFRKVKVIINYGAAGTGKTRIPYDEGAFIVHLEKNKEWWDGYDGEKIILIDEFSGQVPIERLLTLLDGYQCRLPIKGGHTYAEWDKVYITSNMGHMYWYNWGSPINWLRKDNYRATKEQHVGFMRRITDNGGTIKEYKKDTDGSLIITENLEGN